VEARDFVKKCVEISHGQTQWAMICRQRSPSPGWETQADDFTWLETAFAEHFLQHLRWFGGLDHEWRSGAKAEQGGFWALLWSKDPRRLWWELLEEFERRLVQPPVPQESPPWLIWLAPR
jgi:hypothetical protein